MTLRVPISGACVGRGGSLGDRDAEEVVGEARQSGGAEVVAARAVKIAAPDSARRSGNVGVQSGRCQHTTSAASSAGASQPKGGRCGSATASAKRRRFLT